MLWCVSAQTATPLTKFSDNNIHNLSHPKHIGIQRMHMLLAKQVPMFNIEAGGFVWHRHRNLANNNLLATLPAKSEASSMTLLT